MSSGAKRERGGAGVGGPSSSSKKDGSKAPRTGDDDSGGPSLALNLDALVLAVREAQRGPERLVLLRQALNSPDNPVFGELLELPNVNELRHSEDGHEKQLWSLVHLFAYDTFTTYSRNKSLYGELTPAMERKLKQLSIVSLAARHHVISYTDLKEELDIYDIRELEDLLLDTFYLGWISGKLDAKGEALHVDFAISRDVRENDLVKVQAVLEKWCNKAEVLMETIDKKVSELRGAIQKETMDRREFENKVKSVQEQVAAMQVQKGGGVGGGGEFFMDDERGGGGGGGGGQRRAAKTSRRRPN